MTYYIVMITFDVPMMKDKYLIHPHTKREANEWKYGLCMGQAKRWKNVNIPLHYAKEIDTWGGNSTITAHVLEIELDEYGYPEVVKEVS